MVQPQHLQSTCPSVFEQDTELNCSRCWCVTACVNVTTPDEQVEHSLVVNSTSVWMCVWMNDYWLLVVKMTRKLLYKCTSFNRDEKHHVLLCTNTMYKQNSSRFPTHKVRFRLHSFGGHLFCLWQNVLQNCEEWCSSFLSANTHVPKCAKFACICEIQICCEEQTNCHPRIQPR